MDTVKLVHLIETTLTRRGKGVESDPVRVITQYWTVEGKLVAEVDPFAVDYTAPQMSKQMEEVLNRTLMKEQ